MFAPPPSRTRTPARGNNHLNGTEYPAINIPRRADNRPGSSPGLIKSSEWQNYKSASRNGLLVRSDEATKLGVPLVAGLPNSPPPEGPPPQAPYGQTCLPISWVSAGNLPVTSGPSFYMPVSPSDFSQEPRRAPQPPERSPRPPSELFLPRISGVYPVFQNNLLEGFQPRAKHAGVSYTDVGYESVHISTRQSPQRWPKRAHPVVLESRSSPEQASIKMSMDDTEHTSVRQATLSLGQTDTPSASTTRTGRNAHSTRSSTSLPYRYRVNRTNMTQPAQSNVKETSYSDTTSRADAPQNTNARPQSTKRPRATTSSPSIISQTNTSNRCNRRSVIIKTRRTYTTPTPPTVVKRRETMRESFDSRSFPREGSVYGNERPRQRLSTSYQMNRQFPPRFHSEISSQPRRDSSTSPRRVVTDVSKRPERGWARSTQPSSPPPRIREHDVYQGSKTHGNRDSGLGRASVDSSAEAPGAAETLKSVPEPTTSMTIELGQHSGSVVTVLPPEMLAWRAAAYLQGPIKLLKPGIVPRKNSLATLEPFQEAVDQMYQQVLVFPRRKSDDAVEEEICDFFHHLGLDAVGLEDDEMDDRLRRKDENDKSDSGGVLKQPAASPMEKQVARESIACMMGPRSSPGPSTRKPAYLDTNLGGTVGPWQTSGISSISMGGARKESLTLGGRRQSIAEMLSPLPENSVLRSSYIASQADLAGESQSIGGSTGSSGFEWDDDVIEIEAASPWAAPTAVLPKRHPLNRDMSRKRARNPVAKLRRLVATASAIL